MSSGTDFSLRKGFLHNYISMLVSQLLSYQSRACSCAVQYLSVDSNYLTSTSDNGI